MKKLILAIVVMISISILMIGGCQKDPVGQNVTATGAFIGGTDGLGISFLQGAPPDEVYDTEGYTFDVNVKVTNKGEFTVPGGNYKVDIIGIDPDDFDESGTINLADGSSTEDLIKNKVVGGQTIAGTSTNIAFSNLDYDGKVTGSVQFIVRADLCHLYQTKANSKICVLENLLGTTPGTEFCNPNVAKTVENSGAPVRVENLVESVTGKNKVAYTFIIRHKGSGEVYLISGDQQCNIATNKNKVFVSVDGGFNTGLSCSPGLTTTGGIASGEVRLYGEESNEQTQVRCTQEIATPQDLEKLVEITLDYDYNVYADKTLKVTHVPE